jgi:opacity protein-like surface antigen
MKKIASILAVISLVSVFFISSAFAQQAGKYYLGFYALYAMENLDEGNTEDKFISDMDVDFDDTWGIQLRGGYMFNEFLSGELMFEYISPFEANINNSYESDLDIINITVNAKAMWGITDSIVPYVLVGAGAMNAYEEITGPTYYEETEWGLGARVGSGFDWFINSSFAVTFEAAYVLGFGNVDHVRYTNIAVGAAYHF